METDVQRVAYLTGHDSAKLATIPDIMALEGPDVLTGGRSTLREGLISQYRSARPWIRFRGLIIQVPDRTKDGLRKILERLAKCLDYILAKRPLEPGWESISRLFIDLTVTQPITSKGLDLFEAVVKIPYTLENDIYNTVRGIYKERSNLGGQHILAMQTLIRALDEPQAKELQTMLLQPWLREGLERCLRDCQAVVRTHIDMSLPWLHFAVELHQLCTVIKGSKNVFSWVGPDLMAQLNFIPSVEQMGMIVEMYTASQAQRPKPSKVNSSPDAKVVGKLVADTSVKQESLPSDLSRDLEKTRHPLETAIEGFCIHRFLDPGKINAATSPVMSAMFDVWQNTNGDQNFDDRRSLAILISKSTSGDYDLRCRCLAEVASGNVLLQCSTVTKRLLAIMVQAEVDIEQAVVDFTKLLTEQTRWAQCWKDLIYTWLKQETGAEVHYSKGVIKELKAAEWLFFMDRLRRLFTDVLLSGPPEEKLPSLLQPQLMEWTTKVSRFTRTLTRLEEALEHHDVVRYILVCSEGLWAKNLLSILESLEKAEGKPVENIMQKIVGEMSLESKNDWEVKECLFDLLNATPETIQACERIWDAKHGYLDIPGLPVPAQVEKTSVSSRRSLMGKATSMRTMAFSQSASTIQKSLSASLPDPPPIPTNKVKVPPSIAEVMVAGWIQDSSLNTMERIAIESLASILNIPKYEHAVPTAKLHEAALFWESIEQEIMREAERLEALQRALKVKDPKGTNLLLQEIGVPDNSLLEDELSELPAGVIDVVEKTGDNEVEISFTLTAYTEMQRGAMGIPKAAKTLLLRLFIDHNGDMAPSFCIHFNNDPNLESIEHYPWICSEESKSPQENFCKTVQTAFIWQLNRIVHTQLRVGNVRIVDLHRFMKNRLEELGHSCISCGTLHKATKRKTAALNAVRCCVMRSTLVRQLVY